MCGRFVLDSDINDVQERFGVNEPVNGNFRSYNIAPGAFMPIIVSQKDRIAVKARWGLVPHWAKDPNIGYRMINARSESVHEKPAYRESFRLRRCLVPSTGFYEWSHIGKERVPYFIRLKNERLFAFAGLYDTWKDAEGIALTSFTILTTTPNGLVSRIHDRMPVIGSQTFEREWLDHEVTDVTRLRSMLCAYPEEEMEAYRVSALVNSPANNSRDLLSPLESDPSLFG